MAVPESEAERTPSAVPRWAWGGAALLATALAAAVARSLFSFYRAHERLPLWDMASHGWGGVELVNALSGAHLLRFLDLLNRQDPWPFGYSLLVAPFLAAGGGDFAAATLLSTVLFALAPALLLAAAREVEPGPVGLWGGLLAAALFVTAPFYRLFALLVMRETTGAIMALAAFALYLRARRLGSAGSWRLAGLAALALFLVKYQYGLLWGATAGLHALWEAAAPRRWALLRSGLRRLNPLAQRQALWIARALWLDVSILALVAGVNPGYWVYAGLLVAAGILIARLLRDRAGVLARWRARPVAARALLATVVLPLWVWALSPYPIHPKGLFAYLRNRSSGLPLTDLDAWLFYPRILLHEYAATPLLAVALLLLALAAALALLLRHGGAMDHGGARGRLLVLTAGLGLAMATLHPFKEPRFLATSAPFVFLLAGLALTGAAGRAVARWRGGALAWGAGIAALLGVAAIGAEATLRGDLAGHLAAQYPLYSGDPAYANPLAFVSRRLARGPEGERAGVLGTSNELSPDLVRWSVALAAPGRPDPVVPAPRRFAADLPQPEVVARLRRWLEEEEPARVLALRPLPGSPLLTSVDFQRYNAWQPAAVDALEDGLGWTITARRRFPGLGLDAVELQPPAPGTPEPRPPSP